jgi:hypothetical protein
VDAIHELPAGGWLVSGEVATDLAFVTSDRRDLVFWDGGVVYAPYAAYGGALALIPLGSNVDAVLLDQTAAVVVSFDVPTTIGTVTYDPADLVRYNGVTFDAIPYFDASAAGIPVTTNLTAGDRTGMLTVFSLDVPTTVGLATYLPGVILSWNGAILGVFDPQPGWPVARTSRVNALTLPPVPFGTNPGAMGTALAVARLGAAMLRLSWTASNCAGGDDTGIYQGTIAALLGGVYDHTLIGCADGFPFLEENIALPVADSYFLLSAHNNASGEEGSYGLDNVGGVMTERPVGAATCVPVQALGCP